MTGITNGEGQVYQSYRYGSFGEITFGAPQYENEYTYNGESYNPNIESQYLRARYYNVVHADFLTEDSYLGNIYEPLTLNRYNYCVSNPVNYRNPSGNESLENTPWAGLDILYWLTGDETYREQADEMRATQQELEYYEGSTAAGIAVGMYEPVQNDVSQIVNPILSLFPGYVKPFPEDTTYIDEKVCQVYDRNDYYAGKCAGNVMIQVAGTITAIGAAKKAYSGLKWMLKGVSGNGMRLAFAVDGVADAGTLGAAASVSGDAVGVAALGSLADALFHVNLIKANGSKVDWDGMVNGSEGGTYTNLYDGLNFSDRALEHMGQSWRQVPVQTLQDAIRYGKAMPDPKGSSATMYYTTMYKNGKMYNLEVLYDEATNTVYHFEYTREARGNLPAISK